MTIFLFFSWAVLSAAGYLGKDTVYKNYAVDVSKAPYFTLVLEGIHDGVYPWSKGLPAFDIGFPGEDGGKQPPGDALKNTEASAEPETMPEALAAAKKFVQVDKSYFDDAVFIGDSRTVGLHDYGGLEKSVFYATVGMNIYDLWTEKFCEVDGEKMTLYDALSKHQYKKIYFQIGINEMGRGTLDGFMQRYQEAVETFQKLQPDAIIYVQGIMRVTQEKSDTDEIFNNPAIAARNERIAQLADNRTVFYIDMNEVVCDKFGNLKKELTFDNLHLYGSKYDVWVDFLMTKGIEQ